MQLCNNKQRFDVRCCAAQGAANVKFRPCIDIHKGKVKQIVGSTLKDLPDGDKLNQQQELKTNFVSDKPSSWYSQLYRDDNLLGGHVIMLGADDASK